MKTPLASALRRAGLWLAAVWLIAVVAVFYALRNPFLGGTEVILLDLADSLAVALLVGLGGALGALILPRPGRLSALERASVQAMLGLGGLSLIVLALGLVGWYPPGWLAWLITLAGLIALHRPALRWLADLRAGLGEAFRFRTGVDQRPLLRTFGGWVIVSACVLLVLSIVPSLAPPTAWDTLVYHLAGPRLYIQAGRIVPFTSLHFLGFPFLTEMLYLWLMLMARAQAGALLHATFGLMIGMLLVGMGRRLDRPLAGWVALLALLASNETRSQLQSAFSDLSAAAYVTAGLWLVLDAFAGDAPDWRSLLWAGVMAGLALGTKYSAAGAVIGLGLAALWLARRAGLAGMLRAGLVLTVPALIVFAPWAIKNLLMYGNPVAPFVWGTAGFDRIDQVDYLHAGSGLSPVELVSYPLLFTFAGGVGDWGLYGSPGPLLAGLLPLTLVGWRTRPPAERRLIAAGLILGAAGLAYWALGAATTYYLISLRLIYPVFPAVALAGALGLSGLAGLSLPVPLERLGKLAVLVTAVAIPLIVAVSILRAPQPVQVTFGLLSERDYLADALPGYYDAIQQVNALPPTAHVLMLWESRTFYCQRDCIPDSLLNRWRHDLLLQPDPHKVIAAWKAAGTDYVLICDIGMQSAFVWNQRGPVMLTQANVDQLDSARQADLRLLWRDPGPYHAYSLYAIH